MPVELDRGVGGLRAEHDHRSFRPVARVADAEHLARVLDQLPHPLGGRVLLLAVLVVGDQEREQIVSDAPVDGLDARCLIRPDAGGDRYRPRREADLLPVAFPLFMRPRDREQLFRVRPRPLPELARQAGQTALVLHVEEELRRPVRVGGDDHLLGGEFVVVQMRGSLRPPRMTRMYLEPAAVEWNEVVDLVQLVDLGAELLRQVEVVGRQLVLGVAAAADVALAARDAAGAPRSDPAEVRIVGLDARASRNRHRPAPCCTSPRVPISIPTCSMTRSTSVGMYG